MNVRLGGFVASWASRRDPGWSPGHRIYANAPMITFCTGCNGSYYNGERWDVRLQKMSGRYICRHCLPVNPEMISLCQSIPYEVLRVVLDNTPEPVMLREHL